MTETPTDSPAPSRFKSLRDAPISHGLLLALFALFTTLILAVSDQVTRAPIAARGAEELYLSFSQVIPDDLHDNDLSADVMTVDDPIEGPVAIHVARKGDAVTASGFELVGNGYSGPIRILIGLDPEGNILGVRVLEHAETPGLGDRVETAKSHWVMNFDGHSLMDLGPREWKVKRDGGVFDQFSGATITPRAVVGTVHRGLEFYERQRDTILGTAAATKEQG